MAQSVEHVIGNDEVISSILITSSNKATQSGCFIFFVLMQIMNKKKKAQAFANRKSFVLFIFLPSKIASIHGSRSVWRTCE